MLTLQSLLEEDRERLLSRISGADRQAAVREVQTELDRLLMTFNDRETDAAVCEAVSSMMQTARSTAGLIDTDGETKIYRQTEYRSGRSGRTKEKKLPVRFWIFLAAGLLAVLWTIGNVWTLAKDAAVSRQLSVFGGIGVSALFLFLTGTCLHSGTASGEKEELHAESTVSAERIFHQLLSVVLTMDKNVEELRTSRKIRKRQELADKSSGFDPAEAELLSQLLEEAYGRRDTDEEAQELCVRLKYYLHQKDIEVLDYEMVTASEKAGDDSGLARRDWFDLIPAYTPGTIRPALVMGGVLLKKGLASNG